MQKCEQQSVRRLARIKMINGRVNYGNRLRFKINKIDWKSILTALHFETKKIGQKAFISLSHDLNEKEMGNEEIKAKNPCEQKI